MMLKHILRMEEERASERGGQFFGGGKELPF